MARAHIQYQLERKPSKPVKTYCQPSTNPTEEDQFAECLVCDGVYASFFTYGILSSNFEVEYRWQRITWSDAEWKKYKKAKRQAKRAARRARRG